ncbi:MAG: hypothetical protein F6K31_17370 [Symploca sp. SIO2G7]|nr:hypothetical protein [Symploca sp. SIO2G7]
MTQPSSNAIGRLTEAIAASRELTDRQLSALAATVEKASQTAERTNQTVERTNQNIDRAVEGMQQSADRIERQVGLMSEHLTTIDIKIEGLAERIDALMSSINGHLKVAEKQADNITELTKLVAIQANTVATLINRNGK